MRIAAIHCIYFSATYATASYLRYIADGMGVAATQHDITGPEWDNTQRTFAANELVIFGAPVFGGRVPALAAERFKLFGGNGPALAVAVYGNRAYDDALLELCDIVLRQGFSLVAAAATVARHSLLSHHATDRPDTGDREEAMRFGRSVLDKLSNLPSPEAAPKLHIKGNFPYKEVAPAPWRPYATDECKRLPNFACAVAPRGPFCRIPPKKPAPPALPAGAACCFAHARPEKYPTPCLRPCASA